MKRCTLAVTSAIKMVINVFMCVCFMASCSKEETPELNVSINRDATMKDTTVTISFTRYEMAPMTRAAVSEVATHIDLWVTDGETTEAAHQSSSDANFGTISLSLEKSKTYTVYAVAHKGDGPATLTDGIISWPDDKVKDTFWYTTSFSPATTTTINAEMQRIVAMFRIETTDAVPATAKKMRITQGDVYDRWNVSSGATHLLDRISTINISSTNADGTATFNAYSIASDTQTLHTITVEALDANDQPIQTKTFVNVPLRNNYRTTYRGEFFTATGMSMSFSVAADWSSFDTTTF